MKTFYLIVLFVMPVMIYADNIKFSAMVIDDLTQEPMKDVCIGAGFTTDNGPVWEGRFKFEHKKFFSDKTYTEGSFVPSLQPSCSRCRNLPF